MSKLNLKKSYKMHGGMVEFYEHDSTSTNCVMSFSVYLPQNCKDKKSPVFLWLSGLTCTDENFMIKAGAQKKANELGLIIVCPDTSPRGEGVANDNGYDLGQGAGFYLNSTKAPWKKHFQMETYLTNEFKTLIDNNFPTLSNKWGISGHSMGGHGALTLGLNYPDIFKSISAFSPICSPLNCPWGEKALSAYLGENKDEWKSYDAVELLNNSKEKNMILIDQGLDDEFLKDQLRPELLEAKAKELDYPLDIRRHLGYDHSYYFISSFIDDHLVFHKNKLI